MPRIALLVFLLASGGYTCLSAQTITVKQDTSISMLFDRFVTQNKERGFQDGWRIQIISTTDRQRMESMRQAFLYRFPEVPVSWVHNPPYYKLRAGAFATKLEAVHLLHLIQQEFSSAYLTQDNYIRPKELLEVY